MKLLALLPLLLALALAAPAQDTNYYVTRSDLAPYAERAELDSYATHETLSNYSLHSDLTAYATLADLAGFITISFLTNYALRSDLPAEIASYIASNPPAVSDAILTNFALRSDLSAYAPLSALDGIPSASTLSAYATLSDLSAYATAADLEDLASDSDLDNYATLADLAAAAFSSSNSFLSASAATNFLPAYSSTPSSTNATWFVPRYVEFENGLVANGLHVDGGATFDGFADFEDDAYFVENASFDGPITFGGETRTNWNERTSRSVTNDYTLAPNDSILWTYSENTNITIHLPYQSPTNSRTVVIRELWRETPNVTIINNVGDDFTMTNPTIIFDWCPDVGEWWPR